MHFTSLNEEEFYNNFEILIEKYGIEREFGSC